jgi:serine/threonine protein kinase
MGERITASIRNLATLSFSDEPIVAFPLYSLWKAVDSATQETFAVKNYAVADPSPEQKAANIIYFFREITTLLFAWHPTVVPLVGWNIRLDKTPPQFSIVSKYLRNDPVSWTKDRGFALTATQRQIILYGVAFALENLHARRQIHQDVQPANILLDAEYYPCLANIGLPTWDVMPDGSLIGTCTRYLAPELLTRGRSAVSLAIDAFAFGMLLYEFLEDREAVPVREGDETAEAAIICGSRPAVTSLSQQWYSDLIGPLWDQDPTKRPKMTRVREYFEDPKHWQPSVNAQVFWKYKAFVDSVRARPRWGRITSAVVRKLYNPQGPASKIGAAKHLPTIVAIILAAIADSRDGVDEQTQDLVKQSLRTKKTLDPVILAPLHPAPVPVSLFTTAIVDVREFQLAEGKDGAFVGTRAGDDRQYAVRRQPVDSVPTMLPRVALTFFRQILTQLYAAHPAVLPLVGWNIYFGTEPPELLIVTELAANDCLTIEKAATLTPTEKLIVLYGLARAMAHMHSLKLMHRDLMLSSVALDASNRPYLTGLGSAKSQSDSLDQSSMQAIAPQYTAPEVLTGAGYNLPVDVYSYAIICYEIIEAKSGIVPGRGQYSMRISRKSVRPAFAVATPNQRALISHMWSTEESQRSSFDSIVAELENEAVWPAGVDPHVFLQYKGLLDVTEPPTTRERLILPAWIARAAQSAAVNARVNGIGMRDAFAGALAFLTTDGAKQESAFTAVLTQSLTAKGCIDPALFVPYVAEWLVPALAKVGAVRASAPTALTPLTGALIGLDEFEIDSSQRFVGAFGQVFKGRLTKREGRHLAVKYIDPTRAMNSTVVNLNICSVLREVMTLIYCRHPAVIPFGGWNFDAQRKSLIVVTDWMEHGALDPAHSKLDATEKSIVAYGAARGLAFAHEHSVIHRDVKPGNVFLNERNYPRIADFGMAKMMDDSPDMTAAMGTPACMAPEILTTRQEDRDSILPADVYAYAITLWMLYTGKAWEVKTRSRHEFFKRIIKGLRPEKTEPITPELWKLLQRMWDADFKKRPRFPEVASLLEQPKCWLPGTDAKRFNEYVTFLEKEAGRMTYDSLGDWKEHLLNSKSARQVAAELENGPLAKTLTGKVAHAVGYVSGKGGMVNEEVLRVVKTSLEEKRCLDPRIINANAHAIDDPEPQAEEDVEPRPAYVEPQKPGYHFEWIRQGRANRFALHLGEETIVKNLVGVLTELLNGQFDLYLGNKLLNPDSTDKLTDLSLGRYLLKIVVRG